ncbi:MAG: phage tail tape measure protein, partial [Bacteroidales bacterium]
MAGNYTRRINLYINGVQVRNDIKSISAEFRKLERQIRTLNIGSREYNREMAKLKYLRSIIDDHNAALRNTQLNLTTLKGLANAFNKYWPVIMGTVGAFTGLIFGARRATEEFAEFDDKLSDIMKVTGMTRTQVVELNKALLQFDTRTAQNDLLDLAWVAGKLGYTAREDILGFVSAADKIVVALAKDLGGNAEDAIKAVGKAVEIFDLRKVYGIEEAMIRVGSTINVLGMASVAQEGYLVNFLERVAGIAPLAGVSAQNILGLAAALDIYGQKSEVSATAYSKLMSKMATETESMAKVMGMSMDEYTKAFSEDANETMLRLFEALKGDGTEAFAQLIDLLGETELDGQRMNQVMGTLVKNVMRIREQQKLSNEAFEKGTSAIEEYNIKNNNAKATLEKKQKRLTELRKEMGERLLPVYLQTLNIYEKFIYAITTLIEFLFRNGRAIISLVAAIMAYRVALTAINMLQHTSVIVTGLQRVAVLALTVAYNKLTGNATRAAAATKLLNAAMVTTPWGIIAAAIASVIAYLITYANIKKQTADIETGMQRVDKQVAKDYYDKEARIRLLTKAIENENLVLSYRKTALEELRSIVPEYHGYLTEEGKLIDSNTQSITDYLTAFKKQIRVQALKDEYATLYTQEREVGKELSEAIIERDRLLQEYKKDSEKPLFKLNKKEADMVIKDITDKVNELKAAYNKIQTELREIEIGIKTEYVDVPGDDGTGGSGGSGGSGGGGKGKPKADYSEDAEIRARIAAKQKYQKGIIKSETDLQTELDKIALRFMRGRLSLMDKNAEDRAELQEKIVDQELKMARDKQKQLDAIYETGVEFSPREKLDLEFNEELKKLNIFHKEKKDLTAEELRAYEALRKKHQDKIDKLDADAIKDEIERRQSTYDTELANLKAHHIKELDAVETYDQAMGILRQTYTEEELKDIKTLNDARLLIQKDQQ